jgi:hypothetical protein
LLFPAMFLFAVGEAFRTGTHKAIIFDWLQREGRGDEKIRVYGMTRSWSKLGSAVSVAVAVGLVVVLEAYSIVFLFCLLPYALNILNVGTYPAYLDGPRRAGGSFRDVWRTMWNGLVAGVRRPSLRRLLVESMGFEGCHRVTKDYVQPVVRMAALTLPILALWPDQKREALLLGCVYVGIYLLSSWASRHADALVKRAGSKARGARWLWMLNALAYAMLTGALLAGFPWVAIPGFVAVTLLQNFWRPIVVGRVAGCTDEAHMATVLSMESQAKSLFAAGLAPVLGWAVDVMPAGANGGPDWRFLPVGVLGLGVCLLALAWGKGSRPEPEG